MLPFQINGVDLTKRVIKVKAVFTWDKLRIRFQEPDGLDSDIDFDINAVDTGEALIAYVGHQSDLPSEPTSLCLTEQGVFVSNASDATDLRLISLALRWWRAMRSNSPVYAAYPLFIKFEDDIAIFDDGRDLVELDADYEDPLDGLTYELFRSPKWIGSSLKFCPPHSLHSQRK